MNLNAAQMREVIRLAWKEGFNIEQNPTVGFMSFSNGDGEVHVSFEFLEFLGKCLAVQKILKEKANER